MKQILDYDPVSGMTTTFEYDSVNDTTIIGREQDVSPLLEINKLKWNSNDHTKSGIKRGWWEYADIPNIVIEKWLNEDGINIYDKNHKGAVYRKLNDPEYRYLKTTSKFHRPKE